MSEFVYLACISDDRYLCGPVKLFAALDAAKRHLETMAMEDQFELRGNWTATTWGVGDGEEREAVRVIDSYVTRGPITLRYWMQVVALAPPDD